MKTEKVTAEEAAWEVVEWEEAAMAWEDAGEPEESEMAWEEAAAWAEIARRAAQKSQEGN